MYSAAYITLVGNVTRPPEVTQAGASRVCSFSVAVSTGKRDENERFISDFYRVSVFGDETIQYVLDNVMVGARVRVIGAQIMKAFISKKMGEAVPDPRVTAFDLEIIARPRPKDETEDRDEANGE